jgi:hypothetical protein
MFSFDKNRVTQNLFNARTKRRENDQFFAVVIKLKSIEKLLQLGFLGKLEVNSLNARNTLQNFYFKMGLQNQ